MSLESSPEVTREIQMPPKEQEPAKPSELGMFKSLLANPEAFDAKAMNEEEKRTAKTALERQISLYREPPKDAEELRGRLGEATAVVDMKTLQAAVDRVKQMTPEQKAEILGTYEKALEKIEPRRSILDEFDELNEAPIDTKNETVNRFEANERLLADVDREILKRKVESTGIGSVDTILKSEALQTTMSMNAEQVAEAIPGIVKQLEAKLNDPNTTDAEAETLSDELLAAKKIEEIASHIPDRKTRELQEEAAQIDRVAASIKAKLNDPKTPEESLDALSSKYMTATKLAEETKAELATLQSDPKAAEAKAQLDAVTDAIRYLRHPKPERDASDLMGMLNMDDQNKGRALIELADPDAEKPVPQTHLQALENEYRKRFLAIDAQALQGTLREEVMKKQQEYRKKTE